MLRMVIFDFDGVIADSENAHFQAFRDTLVDDEEIEISRSDYWEKYLGYTDLECLEQILLDNDLQPTAQKIEQLFQRKKTLFRRYIEQNQLIMPPIPQLLEELRTGNIICSICSGALRREIELILEKANLRDYFTVIVAADDVSQGKPHPQGFQLCISRVNANSNVQPPITPSECVVIEDSFWGIQAAHAANIACLALATSYPPPKLRTAEMVVKDLSCIQGNSIESLRRVLEQF